MIIEKGYAKINLGLNVVRKREDSFHDLDMIMTSINLYDELYIEDNASGNIIIECDQLLNLKPEDNLVYKAIDLVRNLYHINKGVKVRIIKRIPEQAGLGGGSADAAAVLRGVNQLWELNLPLSELAKLGFQIGSDVPFCIYNRTARVRGRGEIIEFIEDMPFTYLLLVFPDFRSSTREVFQNYIVDHSQDGRIDQLQTNIEGGSLPDIAKACFNDLEKAVNNSEIAAIKSDIIQSGALGALMSGSGSTVYGICHNSEKNALQVLQRFNSLSSGRNHPRRQAGIYTVRSMRKATKVAISDIPVRKNKQDDLRILFSIETKAYAMLPLAYQAILNNYITILTPLSLWDNISIQKLNHPVAILTISDGSPDRELSSALNEIVQHLGFGLRVSIKRNVPKDLGLLDFNNYLCAIITGLKSFGCHIEDVFTLFPAQVKAYRDYRTVMFDSKSGVCDILNKAVFGHALLVDLNLKNYHNPRYTKQAGATDFRFQGIITGISEKNFYKMATNSFNGLEKFDGRQIDEYRGRGFLDKIKTAVLNYGAANCYLTINGRALIILARYEKNIIRIKNLLRDRFNLKNSLVTSLKTDVIHRTSVSKILKTVEDIATESFEDYTYDESSPFINDEEGFDDYQEEATYRKSKRRRVLSYEGSENDYEGILLLNSGGSIFKQYDFSDIAKYFKNFFDGKYINFNVDGKEVSVIFKTEHLPHILGIHLLDEGDPSYRGKAGFMKLLNGEISYRKLKSPGFIDEKIFRQIINKTQSSVLIFNDIFNNCLDSFYCFPRELIVGEDTKMVKFEFGITRMLSGSTFHKQHLLGIGRDETTNRYFFYTSFIWQVPAHIGKKDSYSIIIS
ncbi:MAG: 4-(cytidine 5'-diphospho)-2-C-methyl-D-erythritol kinase [Acholeplasmataceae bacterium]|nr:4-(cytidine 5'-diphospho)-2-C-methyl-D-erythritol kinase [Acholeplasmataceae bacterium]